jgi:hypothetical protein
MTALDAERPSNNRLERSGSTPAAQPARYAHMRWADAARTATVGITASAGERQHARLAGTGGGEEKALGVNSPC